MPEVGDYRLVNGSLRKYQAANVSSGRRLGLSASRRMRRQDSVKGEVVLASFLSVARRNIDPRLQQAVSACPYTQELAQKGNEHPYGAIV